MHRLRHRHGCCHLHGAEAAEQRGCEVADSKCHFRAHLIAIIGDYPQLLKLP